MKQLPRNIDEVISTIENKIESYISLARCWDNHKLQTECALDSDMTYLLLIYSMATQHIEPEITKRINLLEQIYLKNPHLLTKEREEKFVSFTTYKD